LMNLRSGRSRSSSILKMMMIDHKRLENNDWGYGFF
jgi:hypothetical protein